MKAIKTKKAQIQWTIDKWSLKADMGKSALKNALSELWDAAQKAVKEQSGNPVITK